MWSNYSEKVSIRQQLVMNIKESKRENAFCDGAMALSIKLSILLQLLIAKSKKEEKKNLIVYISKTKDTKAVTVT